MIAGGMGEESPLDREGSCVRCRCVGGLGTCCCRGEGGVSEGLLGTGGFIGRERRYETYSASLMGAEGVPLL